MMMYDDDGHQLKIIPLIQNMIIITKSEELAVELKRSVALLHS
jgi:hypothetical protein